MLMMQVVMSQHSRVDWSTDVEELGRLVHEVGWDLKQEKNGL